MSELYVTARLYFKNEDSAKVVGLLVGFVLGEISWEELPKPLKKKLTTDTKEIYESLGLAELRGCGLQNGIAKVLTFGSHLNDPLPFYKSLCKFGAVCAYLEYCVDEHEYDKVFLIGARAVKAKDFFTKVLELDRQLALELAVLDNNIGQVKALVSSGVDLNAVILGRTILFHAFTYVDRQIIQDILLSAGADPNLANSDQNGYTPIFRVSSYSWFHFNESNTKFIYTLFCRQLKRDCQSFCLDRMDELLKYGADVNIKSKTKSTPLMIAASEGNDRICEWLVSAGADVNAQDSKGNTALLLALNALCQFDERKYRIIENLIENGADFSIKNMDNQGVMFFACGDRIAENYFLSRGLCYSDIAFEVYDRSLLDQLKTYVRYNQIEKIVNGDFLSLVASDNDMLSELYGEIGRYGRTALLQGVLTSAFNNEDLMVRCCLTKAVQHGHLDVVEVVLANVTSLAAYACELSHALSLAAISSQENVFVRLLDIENLSIQKTEGKKGALHHIVLSFCESTVHRSMPLFENANEAMNASFKRRCPKIFDVIAKYFKPFPVDYIANLVSFNARHCFDDIDDIQQLKIAEICSASLAYGATVDSGNEDGRTAIIEAAMQGWDKILARLIEDGAQVDIKCRSGRTAVSYAAGRGFVDCVRILLAAGADVSLKDDRGFSPFSYAKGQKYQEIMGLVQF